MAYLYLFTEILAVKLSKILAQYKDISFREFKIGKLIFYGTPRAGKTTLRKNLVKNTEGIHCSSDVPEPSTYIAEISDPILVEPVEKEKDESVQRIIAKNEENNEWKWTVQGLDDVAKTLLQSLDIKLSDNNSVQPAHQIQLKHWYTPKWSSLIILPLENNLS